MRRGTLLVAVLTTLAAGAAAVAGEPDWYYLHPDSLFAPGRQEEPVRLPTNKLFYLEQKYGLCPSQRHTDDPESLNVRMVGKWGGGPSWGVTGRDTLVYLSRGSEVVVINFADTANPEILNYIQAKRLAGRPVLQDSLLYLATSGYIEVFDVSDPTNAPRVGRLSVPVADIDVEDSLVYVIGADSFMVWSFADPGHPYVLGACRDSGYALDVDRGYAYLRDRWGMYILDATDPASPHRIASWGTDVAGVKVRGSHCYAAQGSMGSGSLHVLNVSNPAAPWQEGVLSSLTGEDIYLVDTLLFLPGFDVVNIADSSRPTLVAQTSVGGPKLSVWTDDGLHLGFVAAHYVGLNVLNLTDISSPVLDTELLSMGDAVEASVRNGIACVAAQSGTGLTLLDVADPTDIREVANLDTAGGGPGCRAVVSAESLAYLSWWGLGLPRVRVVDIDPPENAGFVGEPECFNAADAIVLRDSLLYCAEDSRFEVFSVANPRQPVWKGRCDAYETSIDVCVQDTFAYVTVRLQVFSVADPARPYRISETPGRQTLGGFAVRDTFAYIASAYDSLWVFSISNPASPYVLTGVPLGNHHGYDVALRDSYAYAGCLDFRVFDVASRAEPVPAGYHETPYNVRRVTCDSACIYAACYLAGVAVYEMLPVGLEEPDRRVSQPRGSSLSLSPNPVQGSAILSWPEASGPAEVTVRDVVGRVVIEQLMESATGKRQLRLDLSHIRPGVYFLEVDSGRSTASAKLVKQ